MIFELTRRFPLEEKYGLTSQILNSSNSVIANIAEQHGRYYFADKVWVLYIVRGEINETQSHIVCAVSRKYVTREESTELINRYEKLSKRLNGKIKDFKNKKELI